MTAGAMRTTARAQAPAASAERPGARVGAAPGAHAGDGAAPTEPAPDLVLAAGLALPEAPEGFTTETRGGVRWDFPASARDEARDLMAAYEEAWPRIVAQLCGEGGCGELGRDVVVRLGLNPEQMRRLAPEGAPPPAYATGVTYPALGLVLLTFSAPETWERPPMAQVLAHELSHLALYRAVWGGAGARAASPGAGAVGAAGAAGGAEGRTSPHLPRWFVEGLAIHQSGERSIERSRLLLEAAAFGGLVPLRELSARFPERAHHASLAYAQAGSIVGFMARGERGPQKLRRLIAGLRAGKGFDEALLDSHYLRAADLEREWREDVERRAIAMPFVLAGSGVWALGTVLAVLAWRRRRRRHRETLARWAAEEEAQRRAALEAMRRRAEAAHARAEEALRMAREAAETAVRAPAEGAAAREVDAGEARAPGGPVRSAAPPPPRANDDTPLPKVRWGGRDHTLH